MLMLSGIQHYKFCPRQWALIHVEQQWQDNHLTIEGHQLHHKVDQPLNMDTRDGVLRLRSVSLVSRMLGLSGVADLIELEPTDDSNKSIQVPNHIGYWHVSPVEFKHGRAKRDCCDEVQLCAQAMCLEEMYDLEINCGYIFYAATRRRKTIVFTANLRQQVLQMTVEMHDLFEKGITPIANPSPKCKSCSLKDLCVMGDLRHATSVRHYLKQLSYDEETS